VHVECNIIYIVQSQIEDAIWGNKAEQLQKLSEECEISLDDLDKTVQPIIESCTKDAIQVGIL
jgi:calcium homeostasis ER protein